MTRISVPIVFSGAGAGLMLAAFVGALPYWLSPGIAFLAAVWLLTVGIALAALLSAMERVER